MRIISGEFRSRKLLSPADSMTTRPIPDRVKESLFGLLRGHLDGSMVFDGFAGSGAFGLEALSRGADSCVFVEKDKAAAELLKRNIQTLGVEDRSELVVGDALGPGALARCPRPATIVFLDPPYPLVRDPVGWKRVKTQFERLIQCLGDDAFAIIRLPHPFVHLVMPDGSPAREESQEPEPDPGSQRPRDGRARPDRRSRRTRTGRLDDKEVELWSIEKDVEESIAELSEQQIDQIDAREAEAVRLREEAARPQKVIPDLAMQGALGPESHEYGTMAVHLYQRAR